MSCGPIVGSGQRRTLVELLSLDQLHEVSVVPEGRETVKEDKKSTFLALGLTHVRFFRLCRRGNVLGQCCYRVFIGTPRSILPLGRSKRNLIIARALAKLEPLTTPWSNASMSTF